jgi:enoyl-CoA hydratase/carnithine racemase
MAAGATTNSETKGSVEVRREGNVAVVTLRRERKRNALSTHMEAELLRALHAPELTSSRVVVITGGDTVFSAGADITELRDMTPAAIARYYRESGSVYEVFAGLPQPTVAAISGYCLGGGLELALAADIRIADPAAIFGFPEVGIGILPSSGGVTRATRILGPGRTRDLILRGRRIDTAVAETWGLITEIAPAGEHLAAALAVANELAEYNPMTMAVNKQVLDASINASQSASLVLEQLAYALLNNTAGNGTEPPSGEPR